MPLFGPTTGLDIEKSTKTSHRDEWMYTVGDAYLMPNVIGSSMEGTPQARKKGKIIRLGCKERSNLWLIFTVESRK